MQAQMNCARPGRWLQRLFLYLVGMLLVAVGVAWSIRSGLGISPVTSLPYVLSLVSGLDLAVAVVLVYLVFVGIQFLLEPKAFRVYHLLEVVVAVLFGAFTDISKWMINQIPLPELNYTGRLLLLAVSMVLIAIGVVLYVNTHLIPMAMEGMQKAFAHRFHKEFGHIKILVDTGVVLLAAALSLVCTHTLVGIREGTVLSAIVIGKIVHLIQPRIQPAIRHFCSIPSRTPAAREEEVG
ncbi:MAG TPA: hypothetical protein H9941_09445 [Candidatus Flavonifractor avistercoris]|nr:hypothetical protein [Candidatus Flavonifractor avistercoris]